MDQAGFSRRVAQVIEQKNAAMRLPIAVDQYADVVIFCKKYAVLGNGFAKQSLIARV